MLFKNTHQEDEEGGGGKITDFYNWAEENKRAVKIYFINLFLVT